MALFMSESYPFLQFALCTLYALFWASKVSAAFSCTLFVLCVSGTDYVQQMWSFIVPELLQALKFEPTVTVIPEHMQSLAKVGKRPYGVDSVVPICFGTARAGPCLYKGSACEL